MQNVLSHGGGLHAAGGFDAVGALLDLTKAMGGRLVILLPMAFCMFMLLDNQDRMVRLAALVALAVLEQIREWLLVSGIKGISKGK